MRFPFVSGTLFGRTATAFTLAFSLFSLFSLGLVVYFVTMPLTQRVANDLSALVVLTTQIWVELPPGTRPDFEREMREHHDLVVGLAQERLEADPSPAFYLEDFRQALQARMGNRYDILYDAGQPGRRWVDIAMGGRLLRVGFDTDRFITRMPLTLILMVAAGTLIAVTTSLVIVRRITRPLAALANASTRIGEGRRGQPLPEQGASELRELTRSFNQMEQQLRILMENRTNLLAGISHDLRTPLARMQLELELLTEKPDESMLNEMRDDLAEMDQVITATLQLSKGISDEISKQVELRRLLESLVEDYRRNGEPLTLECVEPFEYDLPVSAFRRVLHNLIDNAIRYGDGKPVTVTGRRVGHGILIEVTDQGPGIPSEMRELVLQPFKRLEDSRSRASGGSGLGLAIVDQLCRMNGWRFELDRALAGGTVARLILPLSGR
ncbi:MAG: ATP-binding protein [Candidatus Thiodiazotropha sp.]